MGRAWMRASTCSGGVVMLVDASMALVMYSLRTRRRVSGYEEGGCIQHQGGLTRTHLRTSMFSNCFSNSSIVDAIWSTCMFFIALDMPLTVMPMACKEQGMS